MDNYRQLLEGRAAMLREKKAGLSPARAVFAEAIADSSAVNSKETLTRQLFCEDQVQQIFEQLQQIEDAMQRLANGSFGNCLECSGAISAGRLQLLPETPFCLACQSATEPG